MQSVVPVLTLAASPSDQVETDARFPQDEYFLQTEHLRIGWLGDAIGADAIRRTHHRTAASDPSAPAWTLPLYPTVRLIRSATTRVPTVSSCADVMNTVITAPTLDVAAGPFEPTLHWQNAITTVFRWIQNKLPHRPPVIFRDFFDDSASHTHLDTFTAIVAKALHNMRAKVPSTTIWTILLQGGTLTAVPPVRRKEPDPYTMRVCPQESSCNRCRIQDRLLLKHNITPDASLPQIIAFTAELTAPDSGWSPHYPTTNVFRVPEESIPICQPEDIPADLRDEVQQFFDHHAANLPTAISARSPLYDYDEHGGVILKWRDGLRPSQIIRTSTTPGLQRRHMYAEVMKDLAWSNLRVVPITDIKASVLLFTVFHRVTGEARVCAAPYESNDLSEPAPVKYGVIWDLFTSPSLTCGCRGDIGRGFKHCPLAYQSAVHVAFVLDGIALLPLHVYFGLRDGPRIFVSTLQVDLDSVPSIPVPNGQAVSPLVTWVDDLAKLASDPVLMVKVMFVLAKHLAGRGWKCPPKKWFFLPAALLKYIGYLLDPPVAGARISKALAIKLAITARDLLRVAAMMADAPVTPIQRAIALTHFGRLAFAAKDIPLLAYARSIVDKSIAESRWRPGAMELLIQHAIDAEYWHALRSPNKAMTITRTLFLSTDASVSARNPDDRLRNRVTGGGHWRLIDTDAATLPAVDIGDRSFFSIEVNPAVFGMQDKEVSSTWAEACVSAYGIRRSEPILSSVQQLVLALDAMTVVSRAPKCSTESAQLSGFYAYIHRVAQAYQLRLPILWHSREAVEAKMSDAVSTASTGVWRLAGGDWLAVATALFSSLPALFARLLPSLLSKTPVHLLADDRASIAPAYAAAHVPDAPDRASALRSVSSWSAQSQGLVGLPDSVRWDDRFLAITMVPATMEWLGAVSRSALSADRWVLLLMAVLAPAVLDVIHSMLVNGVSMLGAWSIPSSVRWLQAPDDAFPTFPFRSAWSLLARGIGRDEIRALIADLPAAPLPTSPPIVFRPFLLSAAATTSQVRHFFDGTSAPAAPSLQLAPLRPPSPDRSLRLSPPGHTLLPSVSGSAPRQDPAAGGRPPVLPARVPGAAQVAGDPCQHAQPTAHVSHPSSSAPIAHHRPGTPVAAPAAAGLASPQALRLPAVPIIRASLREVTADLLTAPTHMHLAHGVSASAEVSDGVAVPIVRAAGGRDFVRAAVHQRMSDMRTQFVPSAIMTRRSDTSFFVHLVNKRCIRADYPTHQTLYDACVSMWTQLRDESPVIAMPRIASGRDRMPWQEARSVILRSAAGVPRPDSQPWDIRVYVLPGTSTLPSTRIDASLGMHSIAEARLIEPDDSYHEVFPFEAQSAYAYAAVSYDPHDDAPPLSLDIDHSRPSAGHSEWSQGGSSASGARVMIRWFASFSIFIRDRLRSAAEFYTAWMRSGHCPGDGPDTKVNLTPALLQHLTVSDSFLQAHRRGVGAAVSHSVRQQKAPALPAIDATTPVAADATTAAARLPTGWLHAAASKLVFPSTAAVTRGASASASPPMGREERRCVLPPAASAAGAAAPAASIPASAGRTHGRTAHLSSSQASERQLPALPGAPAVAAAPSDTDAEVAHKKRCRSDDHVAADAAAGAAAKRFWVDSDQRCGQCHAKVSGRSKALLCDDPSCEGWLLCRQCVEAAGLSLTQGQTAPLLCPKHQLLKFQKDAEVLSGLERAMKHEPGTIGRFLGCLTAWLSGTSMSQVLSLAPIIPLDKDVPLLLRSEAYVANDALWDDTRRNRLRSVCFKLLWLADKLKAADVAVHHIRLLAEAYCRHRLSNDRPPGWLKAGAKHVASEISAVSSAADDLSIATPAYLGAKRCLEARGAFQPREHSPKFPLLPYAIFELVDNLPKPMTPKVQQAADALEWNAFWGLRPLYLESVTKPMYTAHNGGFLLKWRKATKVKRGDRTAGADAVLLIPQITAARHPRLTRIYASMPEDGSPPFKGYRDEATKLIKQHFTDIPEDFILCISAQRNGVDMAFLGLGVDADATDAHLWWARNAMRGYYAGLHTAITMVATELLDKVFIKPIAPGWYDKISMPPPVDWANIKPFEAAALDATKEVTFVDKDDGTPNDLGARPSEAPRGVPPHRARIRGVT